MLMNNQQLRALAEELEEDLRLTRAERNYFMQSLQAFQEQLQVERSRYAHLRALSVVMSLFYICIIVWVALQ